MKDGQQDRFDVARLGAALETFTPKLESDDVLPAAQAIAALIMKTESDLDGSLERLATVLAALSIKLEGKGVLPLEELVLARMSTVEKTSSPFDGEPLLSLGEALAALSSKVESKDVIPLKEAMLAQMETNKSNGSLAGLGRSLARLGPKTVDSTMLGPANLVLVALKTEWNEERLRALAIALDELMQRLPTPIPFLVYGHPVTKEQVFVDLLKRPSVVGRARAAVLDGLEKTTGAKFGTNVWQFVDWATETDAGRGLKLDLENPPRWK